MWTGRSHRDALRGIAAIASGVVVYVIGSVLSVESRRCGWPIPGGMIAKASSLLSFFALLYVPVGIAKVTASRRVAFVAVPLSLLMLCGVSWAVSIVLAQACGGPVRGH